jgi:beta-glucosidase
MRRHVRRRQVVPVVLALILLSLPLAARAQPRPLTDAATEKRIQALLAQMTLEEKLGQLNQFSSGQPTGPGTGRADYAQMIASGQIGSLLNVTGAKETNDFQRIAMTRSRLKIPILFGLDVIHGYRTTFPVPLALASSWDAALVERVARAAAREATSEGVRWTFSPMVDIARDARWGRIVEGAGEDPYLGSRLAAAYVRGYQGTNLADPSSMAACVKHYVGYGAAEGGRDYNTTELPERILRDVYLPPFHAAVDAGAATLMSSFNAINGVPATANAFTLDQVLRREWGFRGMVVSDWSSIGEMRNHGIANDGATAARKALLAGVDMDMEAALFLNELPAEIKAGRVPISAVDEAVRRVLRVKFALGLFDHPYTEESRATASLDAANVELARTAAEESFVLLKNAAPAGGPAVLPLDAAVRSVALIGPLADSAADMLGSWAAKGDPKDVVTLRAALARSRFQVDYEKGTEILGGTDAGLPAAVEAARRADVVLLAVGEDAQLMTGEAGSRAFITLPGLQERLVEQVVAVGKPVVLVVFSGRPLALTSVVDKVRAVVQAWHPGIQAGPALMRVLTGEAGFCGRLTVSLPRSVGQEPLYYNHLSTGRPAGRVDLTHPPTGGGEKYVSRYVDEQNAPLFPFGFGLTYTKFDYGPPVLSRAEVASGALKGSPVRVTAEVRNAGQREGTEVVQCYIQQRGTSVARPVRELKGFERVTLKPGESRRVEFAIGAEQLSFWTLDGRHSTEAGEVTVWVGPDAEHGASARLVLK